MRQVLLWPDPRLSQVCDPVGAEDVTDLAAEMFQIMYDAPGRGLAAPQIGVMKRVFVMDCGWKDGEMTPLACIDPEILAFSDDLATGEEGCLSIPGTPAGVTRPAGITLRFRDLNGEIQTRDLQGFEAKCAQHEYDHLDGRVIFDRITPEARAALETAYLETQK